MYHIMKAITVILIIAGLIMGAYPLADRLYTWHLESQVIDDWEVSIIKEDIPTYTSDDFDRLQLVFEDELEKHRETTLPVETDTPSLAEMDADIEQESLTHSENPDNKSSSKIQAIGRIEIPKIEVKIPIVKGTGKANLKVGAGHITGTSELGGMGNSALAAHRSHTYGKMFNRLDELKIGDTIKISTSEDSYEYTVYEILVVTPDDISVLYGSEDERVLTLITCTPLYTATHRLIVHAVMR